jgi:hypothetical protein
LFDVFDDEIIHVTDCGASCNVDWSAGGRSPAQWPQLRTPKPEARRHPVAHTLLVVQDDSGVRESKDTVPGAPDPALEIGLAATVAVNERQAEYGSFRIVKSAVVEGLEKAADELQMLRGGHALYLLCREHK